MTKYVRNLILALAVFIPFTAYAYVSPGSPQGFVNDYGNVLSSADKSSLEEKLSNFEKETGNEISVVTVPSLQEDTIENYAEELFKEWGIGKEGKDNGVLLLIALEEREMRIEVGYGLEPTLTDALSFKIINNILKPEFREEKYYSGINAAVDEMIKIIKGEPSNISSAKNVELNPNSFFKSFEVIFFIGWIFLVWLGGVLARSKSWYGGGIVGFIMGIIVIFAVSTLIGVIAMVILIPFGLIFDYIVSKKYSQSKTLGVRPPWWAGGGRPGGRMGGGFGGFGGGSSGGGGASGRW